MLGTIIGDIAGSIYEYKELQDTRKGKINLERRLEILNKKDLFTDTSFISDDTILTVATLDCILNKKDYEKTYREYALSHDELNEAKDHFKYAFSKDFMNWSNKNFVNEWIGKSHGNGAAMRVSPIGMIYSPIEKVEEEAKKSAMTSHNSEEGIKGAQAIASCVYMARMKFPKEEMKSYITSKYAYDLDMNLEELQQTNKFDSTCQITVPQAIYLFLESNGFEDSIRKAISIGGDTDTIAAMVGGISEAYYTIPKELQEKALTYIKEDNMKNILEEHYKFSEIEKSKII